MGAQKQDIQGLRSVGHGLDVAFSATLDQEGKPNILKSDFESFVTTRHSLHTVQP